jgi:3-methylfumaryl-CoA hydratase
VRARTTATTPASYAGWEPHTVTSVETIDPSPVTALHALLDSGSPCPGVEEVLPPLWHWVALPHWAQSSMLAADGHPRRGDFLPPIDLPRRMFAGGEVVLHGDLRVGGQVEREAVVESVEEKTGRSGRLGVVQTRTRLRSLSGELLLEERQDIIYREAAADDPAADLPDPSTAATHVPVGTPLRQDGEGWRFVTEPTLLMRFSAATANAHRIHYDWPYATRVEGYPGLVVHGPLATLVLAETLRLAKPDQHVHRLRHRNTAPLFCGEAARVTHDAGQSERPDAVEAVLKNGDGTLVASLDAEFGR